MTTILVVAAFGCGERAVEAVRANAEVPPVRMQPVQEPTDTEPASESAQPEQEPPAIDVVPGSMRLVVLRDEELLGSESRSLERLERRLARMDIVVDSTEPSDEERTVANDWLGGTAPEQLPDRWRAAETVVVLRVLPPERSRGDRRITRGVAGTLVLRPPSAVPVFSAEVTDSAPWPFGDAWGPWLVSLLEGASTDEGEG